MNYKQMLEKIFKEYDRRVMADNRDRMKFVEVMEEVKKDFDALVENHESKGEDNGN